MANDKDFKVKNGIQPTVYHEGVGTVVSGSEGYYLAGASYDSKSFSVNAQEGSPEGLYFKSDGTKVYVVGSSGDSVDQFSLSTAWDISTASFDSVTFSLASQVTTPKGIFFKPDGTSFYVQGQSVADRYVYQYNMTTAWNISTASYASKSFSTSEDNEPLGVFFKPDGTKAFVTGEQNDKVYQYGLSTAWDASTGSYDSVSFDFSATANYVHGLAFSSDGTKLFLAGYNAEYKIFSYSLSTAWDLTTASYVTSFSINSQETDNKDVQFSTDGTKMYIVGATNDTIFQYSTVLNTNTLDLSTGSVFDLTPTSDIQVGLSNPAASGTVSQATLLLDGSDPTGASSAVSVDLWDGNGTSQAISNSIDLSTDGGLVMAFRRDAGGAFIFSDTEQGVSQQLSMTYNGTAAASTNTNMVTAFNTNGFSIGNHSDINASGGSYVGYTLKKTAGEFDVIKYTGNGSSGQTLSHNLGHKPQLIIIKRLDGTSEYVTWFYNYADTYTNVQNFSKGSRLTSTFGTAFGTFLTSVTDNDVTIDDNGTDSPNESGGEYIMYLFGATGSIVKTGAYAGNGSSDRDIDVGFEPEFVMIKAMANVYDPEWIIIDNKRGGTHPKVIAYSSGGEDSYNGEATTVEFLSNGFKCTGTSTALNFVNRSGRDYQYTAFRSPSTATITYPSTLEFSGGTAPTSPAIGETDVITFSTTDGGTSYQAVQAIDGAK